MKTNAPNPLIPQGTFPDSRGKSRFQIAALTIGAIHLVVLGPLLFQGCKRTTEPAIAESTNVPSAYTPWVEPTNPPAQTTAQPVTPVPSDTVVVTSTQPPSDVATPSGAEHVVVSGDSFWTLHQKYKVSMKAIAEANPGVDSKRLKIGQKLQIPAPTAAPTATISPGLESSTNGGERIHVVKSGDTLWGLSRTYGVKESAIRSANNLRTSGLKVGQKLKIPAKASVATPTETPAPEAPPPATP